MRGRLLQLVAVGLGGTTLALIGDALLFNYKQMRSGLPTLYGGEGGG